MFIRAHGGNVSCGMCVYRLVGAAYDIIYSMFVNNNEKKTNDNNWNRGKYTKKRYL